MTICDREIKNYFMYTKNYLLFTYTVPETYHYLCTPVFW